MKRKKYLNTIPGQIYLKHKRDFRRQYYSISQELKTKNSMNTKMKIEFQEQLLKMMSKFKRRAYRSPIIMSLSFWSNQQNPPSIHNSTKNYLDLLEKPIKELNTNRKRLLFNDDKLINILIVNYNVGNYDLNIYDKPMINIKVNNLNHFLEDINLIIRIEKNQFIDSKDLSFSVQDKIRSLIEGEKEKNFIDNHGLDIFEDKNWIINNLGKEIYESMLKWKRRELQEEFFNLSNLKPTDLKVLFSPLFNKNDSYYKRLEDMLELFEQSNKHLRNLLLSPAYSFDLEHAPVKSGGTSIFKDKVKEKLSLFKNKYTKLFPLELHIGVTIFYIPPKDYENRGIDLDNLARYIIPFVNDILEPPNIFDDINSSIKRYQIIQLPRVDDDPDTGIVRMILEDATEKNIWSKTDSIINKWIDLVED